MGRYGETEVELPQEAESQSLIQFLKGEEGNLELYTAVRDSSGNVEEAFRYRHLEGSWQRDEGWPGSQVMGDRNLDLMGVYYGQDGNYYLGGTDDNYIYHLMKMDGDGGAQEILEEVFRPGDGMDYGLIQIGRAHV